MIDAARTHPMFHDSFHGAGEAYEDAGTEYYTNACGAWLHLKVAPSPTALTAPSNKDRGSAVIPCGTDFVSLSRSAFQG